MSDGGATHLRQNPTRCALIGQPTKSLLEGVALYGGIHQPDACQYCSTR